MALYPLYVKTEAYINNVWVDVSAYVVSDLEGEIGIYDNSYDNRIASTGSLRFKLNNESGDWTPDEDFKKGTPIRVTVNYAGNPKIKFFGRVDTAKVDVGTWGEQRVEIEVLDWFDFATKHAIKVKPVETDKRIDEAVTSLLGDMPIQPEDTDFDVGDETFLTVFDSAKDKSTTFSELNNLVLSELSYIYLKDGGQTLRVEANSTRNGLRALDTQTYKTIANDGGALLIDTNSFLLNHTGGKLLLSKTNDNTFDAVFDNTFTDLQTKYGDNLINDVTFTVFPREFDSLANFTLYSYNLYTEAPAIPIPPLTTIKLSGGYKKAVDGAIPDAAIISQAPDISFNSKADGSGLDYSANLTQNFVAGGNKWEWTITNNGALGYITYMLITGAPIFRNSPTDYTEEDTTSQNSFGSRTLFVRQPYKETIEASIEETDKILDDEKEPRLVVTKAKFLANASEENMAGFMFTDLGNLIHIQNTKPSIDRYYYVQGMNFRITPGGVITYEFILKETYSLRKGLSPLALRYSGVSSSKNIVKFNTVPSLNNLTTKTISAWVYMKTNVTLCPIIAKYDGTSGWAFTIIDGVKHLHFRNQFSSTNGVWLTPNNSLAGLENSWMHVAVSYNNSSVSNVPVIYINGVAQTLTVSSAPVGTTLDDSNLRVTIGNVDYPGSLAPWNFNGLLKDIRVYNRILSSTEINTLKDNPNNYYSLTDGLVFQLVGVKTEDYSDYVGNPITEDMKIIENIYGYRGTASYANVANGELKGADPSLTSY